MGLTPLGWGRHRRCEACFECVARPGYKDKWPHCEANGKAFRVAIEYEFLNGPESNCPLGKWKGVVPVDVPASAEEQRQAAIERAASASVELLKAFNGTIPDTQDGIRDELTRLVGDGHLTADVAAKCEEIFFAGLEK